jgi:hypothetical protein
MGDDNGGGSSVGIVAIIAILILVLVAGYFMYTKMGRGGPAKVDVNVQSK